MSLITYSCCEIPDKKEPEYSYAEVIIDASPNNEWEMGFIMGEGDGNSLILQGSSDRNTQTKFIYKDSPFAVVLNFKKFNKQAVVSTYIDDAKKESVNIQDVPTLPIVILYTNNNIEAATALLDEINFKSTIILIHN